jgi:2-isopropylmalate synthase
MDAESPLMKMSDAFHIYDTTLRDGAQQEGLNLSVHDKLTIARHLDDLGVGFIEGGWPGANPKDTEFFKLAQTELRLKNSTFVAFGATRRPNVKAADDALLRALQDSGAPVVTLVAKSHDRHVDLALKTNLDENLAMIKDSIEFLRAGGQRVFLMQNISLMDIAPMRLMRWKLFVLPPKLVPMSSRSAIQMVECCLMNYRMLYTKF